MTQGPALAFYIQGCIPVVLFWELPSRIVQIV